MVDVKSRVTMENLGQIFEVVPNPDFWAKYIDIQVVPMIHQVDTITNDVIPCALINLGDENIWLGKNQTIAQLENLQIDVSEISTDTAYEGVGVDEGYHTGDEESSLPVPNQEGTSFITSLADVEGHWRLN